jgi:hypothetical protein
MARPVTRQGLIDYCLRSLGAPVIEINVEEDQLEDRVDEALQFYKEYHSDAIIRMYRKHLITEEDITNKYIPIPDQILFVSRVFPISNLSSANVGMFSAKYQMHFNDIYDLRHAGGLANYDMTKQYLELLDMTLNAQIPPSRFNRHMNRLFVDISWETLVKAGDYFIIEAYEAIDEETFTDMYNDMFLKKYLTALIKRQWGANMSKFEGVQLPGGVTFNGRQMLEDATAELEKLEEQMQLKYEEPPHFFIG